MHPMDRIPPHSQLPGQLQPGMVTQALVLCRATGTVCQLWPCPSRWPAPKPTWESPAQKEDPLFSTSQHWKTRLLSRDRGSLYPHTLLSLAEQGARADPADPTVSVWIVNILSALSSASSSSSSNTAKGEEDTHASRQLILPQSPSLESFNFFFCNKNLKYFTYCPLSTWHTNHTQSYVVTSFFSTAALAGSYWNSQQFTSQVNKV